MLKKLFILIPLAFGSMLILSGYEPRSDQQEIVDEYYLVKLERLQEKLKSLQQSCKNKHPQSLLQEQFKEARIAYKEAAIFIEYFNVYESKYLNGPALKKVEEDNPSVIVEPQGFQVLEEKLFGEWEASTYGSAADDLEKMLITLNKLITEPDRAFKFRDERVWDALRAAVLRVISMGISGFDSPVAQYSLQEAVATLDGVEEVLGLYQNKIENKERGLYKTIAGQLAAAKTYLSKNTDFVSFDRLSFITQFSNPLSASIVHTRLKLGYTMPSERTPVNPDAPTIFDTAAFDIRFFSPTDRYSLTPKRINLGRKLFSDRILSGNNSRSCASCHQPQKAFTDGLKTAVSIDNKSHLSRNTPTLWNSAFQTRQFFDSRTSTLEDQLSAVVHNPKEMLGSLEQTIPQLKSHGVYKKLFEEAYPDHQDPIIEYNIANAIASYIRTLTALNSRFDQFMRGDHSKLNAAEKNGFNLFMGKAKCATCHYMPLFNGLVPTDFVETESEVLGVPSGRNKRKAMLDPDEGKFKFTTASIHRFAFKTASLRNIALTAPYMHNGVFPTLEEVMEFYNNGGGAGLKISPGNQTLPAEKLNLTKNEIRNIIAFMHTLTDTSTIHK